MLIQVYVVRYKLRLQKIREWKSLRSLITPVAMSTQSMVQLLDLYFLNRAGGRVTGSSF